MTWEEISEIDKSEFGYIGHHSHTHDYLIDKDEIEVEFLVSVVEKTFVPLLKSLIGKDSDDSRKVINLLHYLIIFFVY